MTFLRWLFVRAPARFCARAEDTQGRLPWMYIPVMFGPLLIGGLAGRALGLALGDIPKGAASGLALGVLVPLAWGANVLILAAVVWFRGTTYDSLAGERWAQRQRHWYER